MIAQTVCAICGVFRDADISKVQDHYKIKEKKK